MAAFHSFMLPGTNSKLRLRIAFLRLMLWLSRSAAASQMRTEVGRDLTPLAVWKEKNGIQNEV